MTEHWDAAYRGGDVGRGWYQATPVDSLQMLDLAGISPDCSVVDVGGGSSHLVDAMLARGHQDLTVVDLSKDGERIARERLGADDAHVEWQVVDVLSWRPDRRYDVWHDRAMCHFLVDHQDRERYATVVAAATHPGSMAVIGVFAPDGPDRCSGLPVVRYDGPAIADCLGADWELCEERRRPHVTPAGVVQAFTWAVLRRRASTAPNPARTSTDPRPTRG